MRPYSHAASEAPSSLGLEKEMTKDAGRQLRALNNKLMFA